MRPPGRLRLLLFGAAIDDGLGQGFITDVRWLLRLRRARRRPVEWRAPTEVEARWWNEHGLYGRFGDTCRALALVDGRRWAIRDRDWFGWPDPPEFIWFALEHDDGVWAAADFNVWPRCWGRLPPTATTTPPP